MFRTELDGLLKDVCKLDAGIHAHSIQANLKHSGLTEAEWLVNMIRDANLYREGKMRFWFDKDNVLRFLPKEV